MVGYLLKFRLEKTMAKKQLRHASALKAHRKSLVRRAQNFQVRNRVRTLSKKVLAAVQEKNLEKAKKAFIEAQSAWHKAAKRKIFDKKAASRHISRLAARISKLSAKN